jgi:hypothetical protein
VYAVSVVVRETVYVLADDAERALSVAEDEAAEQRWLRPERSEALIEVQAAGYLPRPDDPEVYVDPPGGEPDVGIDIDSSEAWGIPVVFRRGVIVSIIPDGRPDPLTGRGRR